MGNKYIKIRPQYFNQHDYLIYCNNVLVRWLNWIEENKLCQISFEIKDTEHKNLEENASEDALHWLKDNGYHKEMYEFGKRHILCSLVTDFCHYMFESFNCAAKMKPAVAYALLRKPLRDNLAYIEWLRVNPEELIDKLMDSEPKDYDLSYAKEIKKQHIEEICERYGIDRQKGMFEFRYEKDSENSLEKIWNKANHIVTTQNYTKTAKGALNFIFVNKDDWDALIQYYYTVVPLVMSYAVELIVSMFEEMADVNPFTQTINKVMLLLHQAYGVGYSHYQEAKSTLEINKYPLICPYCGKRIVFDDKVTEKLLLNKFRCSRLWCRKKIDSSNYIFDFENLNPYLNEERE